MSKSGIEWPIGITLSTMAVIWACIYTIMIALDNPVRMDNSFSKKYYNVDKNINKFLLEQIEFSKHYSVSLINKQLKEKDTLKFKLVSNDNSKVESAKLKVTLTRPDTAQHDIKIESTSDKDGNILINVPKLNFEGRWNIFTSITTGELKGYYNLKADTRAKQSYSKPTHIPL
ncbi:MAG: FixH family protein [Candidatus Marithrix sp.]